MLISSFFHNDPSSAFIFRAGVVFSTLGPYFLIRCFCTSPSDVIHLIEITAVLLAPVALEMLFEKLTGTNLFAIFGGVPEDSLVRNGTIRAQGPFAHSILAGTIGAASIPLFAGIAHLQKWKARVGIAASLIMVLSSGSSGPILTTAAGVGAMCLWRLRKHTRAIRWGCFGLYLLLELLMKPPAYFILARIDLTGSSTGWHRAELIHSSINHLGEWWFAGTDYTRHWMPTGVTWNEDHTDITNEYIKMGVHGGLPLLLLFGGSLVIGFRYIGKTLADEREGSFVTWAIGSALFAHAVTFISVSYFDQSMLFVFAILASISAVHSFRKRQHLNFQRPASAAGAATA